MFMSRLTKQVSFRVVDTPKGKLRGVEKEGGYIFRGVKYAESERFRAPRPVEAWSGIRDALAYGYAAPELQTRLPADQFMQQHYYLPQSEHCQYLNIWTQHVQYGVKRPVLVWFHGGAWSSGSSVEQFAYDGENLSRFGDVVFVSLDYRMNCIGALDLSEYGYEDANWCALEDVLMALRWIQENISCFGGDPDNVTLIGHAGGGPQVVTLMQMPEADGLFHKAALDGNVIRHCPVPEGWTLKQAEQYMAELVVKNLGLGRSSVSGIETTPYWYLADATLKAQAQYQAEIGGRFYFEPVPDGKRLIDFTVRSGLRRESGRIPLLTGGDFGDSYSNCRFTVGNNRKNEWDEQEKLRHIREIYGEKAEAAMEAFREAYPEKNIADVLYLDRKARYKGLMLAQQREEWNDAPTWNWIFTPELPLDNGTVPWHCSSTPYVTHNAQYMEASYMPGVSEKLQDEIASAYVAFAETGDPNCALLPPWPPVKAGVVNTMIFDRRTRLGINHDARLRECLSYLRE